MVFLIHCLFLPAILTSTNYLFLTGLIHIQVVDYEGKTKIATCQTDGHGKRPQGQDPGETEDRPFSTAASVPKQDPR